jgi:hypothetical protein
MRGFVKNEENIIKIKDYRIAELPTQKEKKHSRSWRICGVEKQAK